MRRKDARTCARDPGHGAVSTIIAELKAEPHRREPRVPPQSSPTAGTRHHAGLFPRSHRAPATTPRPQHQLPRILMSSRSLQTTAPRAGAAPKRLRLSVVIAGCSCNVAPPLGLVLTRRALSRQRDPLPRRYRSPVHCTARVQAALQVTLGHARLSLLRETVTGTACTGCPTRSPRTLTLKSAGENMRSARGQAHVSHIFSWQ